MRRISTAIITLSLLLPAATLAAPAPASRLGLIAFHPISIPADVPAQLVTALAQDANGFLWIGTQGGLVRYDGYTFRTYRPDPRDASAIGGAYVRSLRVASDGRIWIGTFADGLSIYDPATDRFTQLRHDAADPKSLAHNRVEGVAEDHDGRIWAATYGGLDRIDPRTHAIDHFRHAAGDESSLADDRTRGVLVARDGVVWIGSSGGLQVWNASTRGFDRIGPAAPGPESLAGTFVSELYEDSRGRVWIGTTDSGAAMWDREARRLHRFPPRSASAPGGLSHFWIYGIAEAASGEIWMATFGGGIDVIDGRSLEVIDRLRHDATLPTTIGGDRLGALLRDRSGMLWAGTWGQGLMRHDPATRAFREIRYSPALPDGITHAAIVRALQMEDGTIWAGTNENGIDIFDAEWRRITGLRPDPRDPGALADGAITSLAQTSDGSIWVGTLDGTLHRRRPQSRVFERFTRARGLPGGPIRAMTPGLDGDLWIASANGLARLDLRTSAITAYHHDPADAASLTSNTVESVAVTPDRIVWIGSDSGLNALDPTQGTIVRVTHDPSRHDSLPNNWVPDLAVIEGRLWVGTPGGAAVLTHWDGRVAQFDDVSSRTHLAPAPVESIVRDAEGHVWLGPRLRVDPRTWQTQTFGPADGCDFRTFFIGSRARTSAGELLFGSPEGLLVVQPDSLTDWDYRPRTVLTAMRVDGDERQPRPRTDSLTLPPRTRAFEIEFAALDLSAPDRNLYRYRLDGFDRDWNVTSASRRSLTYTNLRPGSYVLHLEGSNRTQRWSGDELRVAVTVQPMFYQTAWFAAAVSLLVVGIVYAAYRGRVRRLEHRGRELERIVGERTAALEDAYAQIKEASLTDPVTQLRNRRFLEQTIASDLELAQRLARQGDKAGARDHVCLLLDLDHFKGINDRYGHAAGDAVLVQLAETLRATVRASDHLVRWGGEEFLIVARFNDRREAQRIAEKIREAVAARRFNLPSGEEIHLTCSLGFAVYPFSEADPAGVDWENVVALADAGLYEAKRRGRNGWVGFDGTAVADAAAAARSVKDTGSAPGVTIVASQSG